MTKEKVLILYSGGADSRLLLEFAGIVGMEDYCILIDYKQLHSEELEKAKKQLEVRKVPYSVVTVNNLNVDSGLTGSGKRSLYKDVNEWHVPGRNSIFLSIAFSIAESKGFSKIWIGCDYSDRINLFPDCYQEYIVAANDMFSIAGSKKIEIEAPLLGMTKEMVISFLESFEINQEELFSGYGNLSNKWGKNERKKLFRSL